MGLEKAQSEGNAQREGNNEGDEKHFGGIVGEPV